jgi:perosamine synthetase
MIPLSKPILGEEEVAAVAAVLRSGNLAQGELVARLEDRFAASIGVRHAVAVSSGTAALHIALLAHGIGPGDEVITSPFTFIATANAVLYTGGRPVFVDIADDSFNIRPDLIEAAICPRTKAILAVHLYGRPADMPTICAIAERHGLAVIEDAAQAHAAAIGERKVGSFGTGCFSFYATKNLTTAEGGLVTTNDTNLDEKLRMLRSHGQRERYLHELLGYNYRLTDLQAAVGLVQLDRLEELTCKRIANARYLTAQLPQAYAPGSKPGERHVYHQYTVRFPVGRDGAARALQAAGVGTGIHYPLPVHWQPLYRDLGYRDYLPAAERASREVLSVPVHPGLTASELETIAREVGRLTR